MNSCPKPSAQVKLISLIGMGGALEFYDFTIYALFAPYLSQYFFPHQDPVLSLLNTFAVFALGYLARPLGGMVFGHFGDKWGRKYAFTLAILLMASSTLLIGLLPGYQLLGNAAPILLLCCRLLQGFSVGGEIPGATIFILEHIPMKRRGVGVATIFMCITLGNVLGAGIGFLLTACLSTESMALWGWRLPFVVGFFLAMISFIVRRTALETPAFKQMQQQQSIHRFPLLTVVKTARRELIIGFSLTAVSATTISLFLYLPTYFTEVFHFNVAHSYFINSVCFITFAVMTLVFGWVSDYVGRRRLMLIGSVLLIPLSYLLFINLSFYGESFVWVFAVGLAVLTAMLNGCFGATIAELFPANLRASGVGLCYNLGFCVFGGAAPFIFTYLINSFADVIAPYYYLLVCIVCTLVGTLACRSKATSAKQTIDAQPLKV